MKIRFVHGLGLCSNVWNKLLPLLKNDSIFFDLPGHGYSVSTDYSWGGVFKTISESCSHNEWSETILVLHSFSACALPEIIQAHIRPRKLILIEGVLENNEEYWSNKVASLNKTQFNSWLVRFRSVSEMSLKSQLVTNQKRADIKIWSNSFKIVKGKSLRKMSVNLTTRLKSDSIKVAVQSIDFPTIYIKGSNSRYDYCGKTFLKSDRIALSIISNSGHFPMIDNPWELSCILNDKF